MSHYPPPQPIKETPAPNLDIGCPHCPARLSVHPSHAGQVIACPRCGGKFQLPLPNARTVSHYSQGAGFNNPDIREFASKKIAAGICGILLGGLGVHKFILGLTGAGAIMLTVWLVGLISGMCLIVPLFASIVMNVIGLVEGIIYLTKSDEDFYQTYAIKKQQWF